MSCRACIFHIHLRMPERAAWRGRNISVGLQCVRTQSPTLTGLCPALQYQKRLNALYEGQLDSEMVAAQARQMGAQEQARAASKTSKTSRKGRRRGSNEQESAETVGSNINSGQMAAMMRIMEQQR